jgi:uncharacterized protein YggE
MPSRLLPLALAATLALPLAARAADQPPVPQISVSGQGEAALAPDMAWLSLSIRREADTARAAMDDASKAAADVIAALKQAGVASRDLQTSGLNIEPRYVYPKDNDGTQQPKLVGYAVTNSLSVRVRDLARLGELIDSSVTLGVNQGAGISFDNDDPAAALTEARSRAVADAIAKARTLAEAAGVKLGRVLQISESSAPAPMPMQAKAFRAADAASVPIEAGENTYHVDVNVSFEIDD